MQSKGFARAQIAYDNMMPDDDDADGVDCGRCGTIPAWDDVDACPDESGAWLCPNCAATTPDLDAPRCEGCMAPLLVRENWRNCIMLGGIVIDADGWAYSCGVCTHENDQPADYSPPTWRTIAPELCAEIERLRAVGGGE